MDARVEIVLSQAPVERFPEAIPEGCGAWLEFRGIVRGEEQGRPITALEYEAYEPMARSEIERLIRDLLARFPCAAVLVTHRLGMIPVGETAIAVRVASRHRAEALSFMTSFMDRLKQDVPIWKTGSLP